MKNVIVTIAEILLGILLFTFILTGNNSLKVKSEGVFNNVISKLKYQEDKIMANDYDPTPQQ